MLKVAGGVAFHPAAEGLGAAEVSVIIYPVTATLSVAAKTLIATVSDVDVEGTVKAVTTGATASGRVTVTVALSGDETFPAASFAQP